MILILPRLDSKIDYTGLAALGNETLRRTSPVYVAISAFGLRATHMASLVAVCVTTGESTPRYAIVKDRFGPIAARHVTAADLSRLVMATIEAENRLPAWRDLPLNVDVNRHLMPRLGSAAKVKRVSAKKRGGPGSSTKRRPGVTTVKRRKGEKKA